MRQRRLAEDGPCYSCSNDFRQSHVSEAMLRMTNGMSMVLSKLP